MRQELMPTVAQDEASCWICLGPSEEQNLLTLACKCPRPVHLRCLAQWQLHSAGSREESTCRFCSGPLPDWRHSLTHDGPAPANQPVQPTVSVHFGGSEHRIRVSPTPEGMRRFQRTIEVITGVPFSDAISITFVCKVPQTGHNVQLQGMDSFDAAMHCASISAAERAKHEPPAAATAAAGWGQGATPALGATGEREARIALPEASADAQFAGVGGGTSCFGAATASAPAGGSSSSAARSMFVCGSTCNCHTSYPAAPPPPPAAALLPAVPPMPRARQPASPRQLQGSWSPIAGASSSRCSSACGSHGSGCTSSYCPAFVPSDAGGSRCSSACGSRRTCSAVGEGGDRESTAWMAHAAKDAAMRVADTAVAGGTALGKRPCDPAWSKGMRGLWSRVVGL